MTDINNVIIKRKKNHSYIIGEESKDTYSTKWHNSLITKVVREIADEFSDHRGPAIEGHEQQELEALLELYTGNYRLDIGDFRYEINVNPELELTQQAYIDGKQEERPYYKAEAEDGEGNKYEVTWDVVDNYEEIEDEEEMCEWDSPSDIEII